MTENLPASFEELLKTHSKPILVDFWADWCMPCKMMAPVLSDLARDWKEQVTVIKINTDEKQFLAIKYGIQSIPTLILFKQGKEVKRISGAMSLAQLKAQFQNLI